MLSSYSTPWTSSSTSPSRKKRVLSDKEATTGDSLAAVITQRCEELLVPIRHAYEEEREALVREHRSKDLAVFDALEELRNLESTCSDEHACSNIREVIADLEEVF